MRTKRGIVWLVASSLLLGGCRDKGEVPYLGRWEGRFEVQSADPKLPVNSPRRNTLKGFLQLYLTDNRCTLHLDGEQEGVEVKGHWKLKRREIRATFTGELGDGIKIDDAGGIDVRDPNKAFVAPADLKTGFSAPIAFHIGPDNRSLTSPLIVIGPLTGHYEFRKESLGH